MISKPGSTTVASFDFHFVLIIIFFSMRERAVFCKSCNLIPSAGSTVFPHPACLRELYLILCVLSRLYKIETEKQQSLSISKRSFRQYCDFLPAQPQAFQLMCRITSQISCHRGCSHYLSIGLFTNTFPRVKEGK